MDWRERNYYLVKTDYCSYKMRHEYYKLAAPSIKYHSPYNHFKKWLGNNNGDSYHKEITGMFYVQEMISCKIGDSALLEYELRKAKRRDGYGSNFVKITKEMCGQ